MTGSAFLWPLNAIYIHDDLGKSLTMAGVILMLNSAAGIVGNLFGGALYDKVGGYRSVITGLILTTLSAFTLVFFHHTIAYTLCLVVIGFGSGMVFPSMYAMAGMVWPNGGRKPFNALYVSSNMGVAIGSSLGGFIASFSFSYIFLSNGIMYLLFLLIAFFFYKKLERSHQDDMAVSPTSVLEQNLEIKNKNKFVSLLILCFGFFLAWIGYCQWQATISPYTQSLGIPLSQYSLLWTINGGLIVISQPLVNFITKRVHSLKFQMGIGILLFMVSFVIVNVAHDFRGFVYGMIALTLGEIFVWPAVPSVAHDLAPKGRAGFYQGFVNSTGTAGRMVGPLFGGIIVDTLGIHSLFKILLFIFVGSMITSLTYDLFMRQKKEKVELKQKHV